MKNKYSLGLRYWVLAVMAATVLESPCELLAADGPPVLAINVEAEKKDLFAAFARNNKSEKREIYEKLTGEQQKKVLTYFQVGKQEQPNEKELLKGVYKRLPGSFSVI